VYTSEDEDNPFPAAAIYHRYIDGAQNPHQLQWSDINGWYQGSGAELASRDAAADSGQWGRLQQYHTSAGAAELWAATVAGGNQIELINATASTTMHVVFTPQAFVFNPYLFYHVSAATNMVVDREREINNFYSQDIVIYAEHSRGMHDWYLFRKIRAADLSSNDDNGQKHTELEQGRPYLLSPEAFTYQNNTYVIFSSADSLMVGAQSDGNIWVARIDSDPQAPLAYVRVNDRPVVNGHDMRARTRVEGEIYIGSTQVGPIVYYSQVTTADDDPNLPDGCPMGQGNFLRNFSLRKVPVTLP
jgi:hypothetical protein